MILCVSDIMVSLMFQISSVHKSWGVSQTEKGVPKLKNIWNVFLCTEKSLYV